MGRVRAVSFWNVSSRCVGLSMAIIMLKAHCKLTDDCCQMCNCWIRCCIISILHGALKTLDVTTKFKIEQRTHVVTASDSKPNSAYGSQVSINVVERNLLTYLLTYSMEQSPS